MNSSRNWLETGSGGRTSWSSGEERTFLKQEQVQPGDWECCFGSVSDLSWDVDNVGRVLSGQTDHMTGLPTSLHRHTLSGHLLVSLLDNTNTPHLVNQLTVHLRCESDEDTLHEKLLSCYSDLIWVRARPWLSQHTMGRFSKVGLACGSSHQLSPISLPTIQF